MFWLRQTGKMTGICLVAALMAVQWLGLSHVHNAESIFEVDPVCDTCLVSEKLGNSIVATSIFISTGNADTGLSIDNLSHHFSNNATCYLSRAPPRYRFAVIL